MNELIDNILTEWSYRVNDGMPDPKNKNFGELTFSF